MMHLVNDFSNLRCLHLWHDHAVVWVLVAPGASLCAPLLPIAAHPIGYHLNISSHTEISESHFGQFPCF